MVLDLSFNSVVSNPTKDTTIEEWLFSDSSKKLPSKSEMTPSEEFLKRTFANATGWLS